MLEEDTRGCHQYVLCSHPCQRNQTVIPGNLGRGALTELAQNSKGEYEALTVEEKAAIVQEFENVKCTSATATCLTHRSKVNDVTYTIGMLEQEASVYGRLTRVLTAPPRKQIYNLSYRSGIECLLFVTRGTTDLALRSVSFATKGVEKFLPDVMKLDEQDFIGKLEGYTVQGLTGKIITFACVRLILTIAQVPQGHRSSACQLTGTIFAHSSIPNSVQCLSCTLTMWLTCLP